VTGWSSPPTSRTVGGSKLCVPVRPTALGPVRIFRYRRFEAVPTSDSERKYYAYGEIGATAERTKETLFRHRLRYRRQVRIIRPSSERIRVPFVRRRTPTFRRNLYTDDLKYDCNWAHGGRTYRILLFDGAYVVSFDEWSGRENFADRQTPQMPNESLRWRDGSRPGGQRRERDNEITRNATCHRKRETVFDV